MSWFHVSIIKMAGVKSHKLNYIVTRRVINVILFLGVWLCITKSIADISVMIAVLFCIISLSGSLNHAQHSFSIKNNICLKETQLSILCCIYQVHITCNYISGHMRENYTSWLSGFIFIRKYKVSKLLSGCSMYSLFIIPLSATIALE